MAQWPTGQILACSRSWPSGPSGPVLVGFAAALQLHSINFTRCSENPAQQHERISWGTSGAGAPNYNRTNDNFPTARRSRAGTGSKERTKGSLKQKLRCNNILTILARKMWPGTQKRKVESLTMLNECSLCVCKCDERRGWDRRPKDATHSHTHAGRRLLASLLRLPKKSAAQIVQIFWLCHAHKHTCSPRATQRPPHRPPAHIAVSFPFAAGPKNKERGGGGHCSNAASCYIIPAASKNICYCTSPSRADPPTQKSPLGLRKQPHNGKVKRVLLSAAFLKRQLANCHRIICHGINPV